MDSECFKFVQSFTRPMRCRPDHLILDGFDIDYFLIFNFEPAPECPDAEGTCDINLVPLESEDFLADQYRLVIDADQDAVIRFLDAMGLHRFSSDVRSAISNATAAKAGA